MTVEVGGYYALQEFAQVTDSVGKAQDQILTCGYRGYIQDPNYPFLNFTQSPDQSEPNVFSLGTESDADEG